MNSTAPHILVLAAGQGKRMHSKLPKVLHPVLFQPMLHHVIAAARSLPHSSLSLIVGHGEAEVRESCTGIEGIQYFRQDQQRGTAHAVSMARSFLASQTGQVLILSGDVILLRSETLRALIDDHAKSGALGTVVTAEVEVPKGYGRILRDANGGVVAIREEADCSNAERAVREVNAGIYLFDIQALFTALSQIKDTNRQGEFYLTDVISILVGQGDRVGGFRLEDPREMTGVNDRLALSEVETILQERINREWMLKGISIQAPHTVFIDARTQIGADVRIESGCRLINSRVEDGAILESDCRITDSLVRSGALVRQGCYVDRSEIGRGSQVGPYAQLRPGAVLGDSVKIGNFVEIKNSRLADGAKASHLAYIGDAEIGKNVNLGCGFITCNFDGGPKKNKTIIEDDVFVGSDTQAVAPVRVGRGSYVASGTTLTEDVPPDSLALSRGRQVTKTGYAAKYRDRKPR